MKVYKAVLLNIWVFFPLILGVVSIVTSNLFLAVVSVGLVFPWTIVQCFWFADILDISWLTLEGINTEPIPPDPNPKSGNEIRAEKMKSWEYKPLKVELEEKL